jgi:uncharacterized protein with HEPN domain
MENEIKKYLFDIQESIGAIESYVNTVKSFDGYSKDRKTRRAVEREFEIIGEAMNRINKLYPDLKISNKRQIIDMRNKVIHGYDMVDDFIIWGTIERFLPKLKLEIRDITDSDL